MSAATAASRACTNQVGQARSATTSSILPNTSHERDVIRTHMWKFASKSTVRPPANSSTRDAEAPMLNEHLARSWRRHAVKPRTAWWSTGITLLCRILLHDQCGLREVRLVEPRRPERISEPAKSFQCISQWVCCRFTRRPGCHQQVPNSSAQD